MGWGGCDSFPPGLLSHDILLDEGSVSNFPPGKNSRDIFFLDLRYVHLFLISLYTPDYLSSHALRDITPDSLFHHAYISPFRLLMPSSVLIIPHAVFKLSWPTSAPLILSASHLDHLLNLYHLFHRPISCVLLGLHLSLTLISFFLTSIPYILLGEPVCCPTYPCGPQWPRGASSIISWEAPGLSISPSYEIYFSFLSKSPSDVYVPTTKSLIVSLSDMTNEPK